MVTRFVLLLVGFADELAAIAQSLTPGTDSPVIAKQIAHAHVMLNCCGVLAALPFTTYMVKGMMCLIPDKALPAEPHKEAEPEAGGLTVTVSVTED